MRGEWFFAFFYFAYMQYMDNTSMLASAISVLCWEVSTEHSSFLTRSCEMMRDAAFLRIVTQAIFSPFCIPLTQRAEPLPGLCKIKNQQPKMSFEGRAVEAPGACSSADSSSLHPDLKFVITPSQTDVCHPRKITSSKKNHYQQI
jgi:hypothetical protein